jgi:type IV pilus assembly protein PilV
MHRCRGFALAEVLVAAALLAVGLLGQLALLGAGLRAERDAANSATAATLAADLAERLRANSTAAPAYVLDPASAPPSPASCTLAAPFDAQARAACDLDEWQREVASSLPGATVEVVSSAVAGSSAVLCAITIRWVVHGSYGGEYTLQVQV